MSIKESTHWYAPDGAPAYTVIGKNGKVRNTTLRDARTMQLVPSVTTIIGVAEKPALVNWKVDQALLAALTLPMQDGESLDAFMKRAKADATEQAKQAAARGTEIHAQIERGFIDGHSNAPVFTAVCQALAAHLPLQAPVAEASFTHPAGFGGKIDLFDLTAQAVIDFKTKDNLAGSDVKKLVYDEHGMQLSAYAMGLGIAHPLRISVFIDRADPTCVLTHQWDAESHPRHKEMFLNLLRYWQCLKNYEPQIEARAVRH